jgi:2',3'-cyclic-nucleotide 2'-phosphodiesterase (5'-nucleotidase family)
MIGGEPLEPKKTYTVASQNYTVVENGDGFTMFDGCNVVQEIPLDNQVLIQYLTGPLEGVVSDEYADPYGQGRIVAVEDSVEKTEE